MTTSYPEREYNQRAAAREEALRELELEELAAGRGPTYEQRQQMMRHFMRHLVRQRQDPELAQMFEREDRRRLGSLVAWVARFHALADDD